jgi:hypothetical protein
MSGKLIKVILFLILISIIIYENPSNQQKKEEFVREEGVSVGAGIPQESPSPRAVAHKPNTKKNVNAPACEFVFDEI